MKQAVESVIEGDVTMEADTIADFEDGGKDHEPKECSQLHKLEKTRKQILPSILQKACSPDDT